jgi:hypothetical protein
VAVLQFVSLLGGAVTAELLALGLFFSGYVLAARLLGRHPTLVRWVGVAVCGTWIASAAFHVLSAFGAFSLPGALGAVSISALFAVTLGSGEKPIPWWWGRDLRWVERMRRRFVRSRHRSIALTFALLAAIVVVHSLLLPPLGWDSLTYHTVKAGMWVQHGRVVYLVAPGTWALYENFWAGAEVLTAWSMLPFHSDTLAMAMQAAHWLVLGLAVVALVRELGAREPYASSVAALVLATPTLRMQVGTGYVEVVQLMFLVSGTALAASFLRKPDGGALLLAAAALGLASGVKFTLLPISLLMLAMLFPHAVGTAESRRPASWIIGAFVAFAIGVTPWLWHAYRTTGAPLSPLPVRLFGVEVGRANPEVQPYLARATSGETLAAELVRLEDALVRGYENPGIATAIAMVLGFLSWPWLLRRRIALASLILLVLVTSLLEYYSAGLSVVRQHWPASSVRFLLVPLVFGVALSVVSCRREVGFRRFYLWFLWAGALLDFGLYIAQGISPRAAVGISGLLVSAAVLGAVAVWLGRRVPSPSLRFSVFTAATSLFLVVTSAAHDRMRPELERVGFVSAPIRPYWLDAATRVDEPSRPRRIAVTSGPWVRGDNWFVYPFLGRHLQNEVLYIPSSRDGVLRHFGSAARNDEYARTADFPSWLARLRHANVTEVMSFSPASLELGWMDAHPEVFRRLVGDVGDWGLFEVDEGRSGS